MSGRYNLLEMVQLILSSMDSDEVNSISDTTESMQVANIIKSVYYDISNDLHLPEHRGLIQLNASGDPSMPCLMRVPNNVAKIEDIRYNIKESLAVTPEYKTITWLPFDEFIRRQQSATPPDSPTVVTMLIGTGSELFSIPCFNNSQPTYWTSVDDYTILFDSYDNTVDTTLQKFKTMCNGVIYPEFTMSNHFFPDLDPSEYSLLINKSKVRAFYELKQQENTEAQAETRRQRVVAQARKSRLPDQNPLCKAPRYGRK